MKTYKYLLGLLLLFLMHFSGLAQSYKVVTVPAPGELEKSLGDDWDKIDSVVVKGTINKVDFQTLYNCSRLGKLTVLNLESATIEGNRIPDYALYYPDIMYDYLNIQRIILPDNVTEIGKYAISMMYLKKINFPSSLKKFSIGSFYSCHWMEMDPLVIPEGITEIPWYCFGHCQSFRKLVLPQSLKMIDGFAFYNTRMEEMNLPEGLDSIGQSAFWGAGELKNVIIPESTVHLGLGAFAQNDSLHNIKFPQSITNIPDLFLAYSMTIDTIIIPDNVTVIGQNAFMIDFNIRYVHFPRNLQRIGLDAFNQNSITEIVFPETIKFIGKGAFFDSYLLEKVYCPAQTPPFAQYDDRDKNDSWPFISLKKLTLYVPIGTSDLYRNADCWKDFDYIIETDNFPSSCGITFAPSCTVSTSDGEIIINNPTDIPTRVSVYAVNGNLVRQEKVVGTFTLTVSPGIYLVKAGRKTEKVVVK
ncbi:MULTISPECIES: leucine-rich repeat domain-containing protein [unclassified Bacteroides]|uniref:leucine-rich repeat domain-containing protein n=1 Tax=unclassified Bacteroides TaxID=2646097 RepID=UPI000E8C6D5F|nr:MULTISPECIES: leucine-rich repeat domain-containing protein [unclassified Bacteroides]RGN41794.1 cell surface protein [Bacteroides sp. OM05-12]RHR69482.1 cell surface protein [Bacteroides sp. AF16-49]